MAYSDNAAGDGRRPVGAAPARDQRPGGTGREEPIRILMKRETHNHPTAISPVPGRSTGAGGEIRDGRHRAAARGRRRA